MVDAAHGIGTTASHGVGRDKCDANKHELCSRRPRSRSLPMDGSGNLRGRFLTLVTKPSLAQLNKSQAKV
jgi:hypothetical protein